MEYNNKAKLKEQNSSRLTDSKKGLVAAKGEGSVRVGGEGGWRELKGIMISTHNVEGGNTEKTSSDFTASYYADGQWLWTGMLGGLGEGGSLVNIMLLM